MTYEDFVYMTVKADCEGLDSIYEDYIVSLVGKYGLQALKAYGKIEAEDYIVSLVGKYGLQALKAYGKIEACGVVNGRRLYVLL